jgi:hypothetical protein
MPVPEAVVSGETFREGPLPAGSAPGRGRRKDFAKNAHSRWNTGSGRVLSRKGVPGSLVGEVVVDLEEIQWLLWTPWPGRQI